MNRAIRQQDDSAADLAHAPASTRNLDRELLPALTSIRDTLSSRLHSIDFAHAHASYLRSRVLAVGTLFTLLVPLWTLVDLVALPDSQRPAVLMARVALLAGLLAVLALSWRARDHRRHVHACAAALLLLPAAFYATLLWLTPTGVELAGYSFIPFLLVASLSVFPFTILQSLGLGLVMVMLLVAAQLSAGSWPDAAALEGLWLITSLLGVALAANHFQLSLLLRVYRQATHDPLTGLFNRGALATHLDKIRRLQQREGAAGRDSRRSLLLLDIDHFKQVNDRHGHSVGDRILADFAAVLLEQVRPDDCVARYGGEEFVVVLEDAAPDQACAVAERLRAAIADHAFTDHDGRRIAITASIGVAGLDTGLSPLAALEAADGALYRAKREGRNRVRKAA